MGSSITWSNFTAYCDSFPFLFEGTVPFELEFCASIQSLRQNVQSCFINFYYFTNNKIRKFYGVFKSRKTCQIRDISESSTVFPVSCIEYLFLPEFKHQRHLKEYKLVIKEQISKGAFGKVYKAIDQNSGKIYAVKIFQKSQIIEGNAISQVKDEINIQKICGHHQFIVKYLVSWQMRTQLFIACEFKSGGELLNLLDKCGPLSESIVKIYVAELDFLHNAGVIFRDLKPENILLDDDGHICLTDFGLSKWLSLGSRTNTVCGTSYYMAPEIFKYQSYGHAVDWWSLGIVFCRLLTDQYPERNSESVNLPENIKISAAAKDLLMRLLEPEPTKRLRTIYALKRIAFFKGFNFDDVILKKIHPKDLLDFDRNQIEFKQHQEENIFKDFD